MSLGVVESRRKENNLTSHIMWLWKVVCCPPKTYHLVGLVMITLWWVSPNLALLRHVLTFFLLWPLLVCISRHYGGYGIASCIIYFQLTLRSQRYQCGVSSMCVLLLSMLHSYFRTHQSFHLWNIDFRASIGGISITLAYPFTWDGRLYRCLCSLPVSTCQCLLSDHLHLVEFW